MPLWILGYWKCGKISTFSPPNVAFLLVSGNKWAVGECEGRVPAYFMAPLEMDVDRERSGTAADRRTRLHLRTSVRLALNCCCLSFDCGPEDPPTLLAIFEHTYRYIRVDGNVSVCI